MPDKWDQYAAKDSGDKWAQYAAPEAAAPASQKSDSNTVMGGLRNIGERALSTFATPLLHPIDTAKGMIMTMSNPYDISNVDVQGPHFRNPLTERIGQGVREWQTDKPLAIENALGDAAGMAAQGGVLHALPGLAEPLKATGGKIIDTAAGLRKSDLSHGAQPGRAYLEGGGTPSLSLKSLGSKAGNIAEKSVTRAPWISIQIRSRPFLTMLYLPGAVLAADFTGGAAGTFTVKSAVLVIVWFVMVSVALISSVYFPGASVASGSSRSIVT